MNSYNYYPYNAAVNYSNYQYGSNSPTPKNLTTMTATSDTDFQYNQMTPVSSNWVNTGTNGSYNPYTQIANYSPNYASPSFNQASYYPYNQQVEQKTFTQQSSKSQNQSRTSSQTSQSNQQKSLNLTEDLNQLTPQIEAAYEAASGKRRQPVVKRQVITVPGQQGQVQQVVRRLPTPTPDVIERVFIVKPQRDTVNLIIERPNTPPVQYKDKTVYGKTRRPIINPKIISVEPRHAYPQIESQYPQNYQDYAIQNATTSMSSKGYLLSPLKYDEQSSGQTFTNMENEPTFSQSNVLQPYNPAMLNNYNTQNYLYQGYQPQYPINYFAQQF